jgi:hypothetical protein
MNAIGHKDIDDYVRDLISDGFGPQPEEAMDCDDQPAEEATADPSTRPVQTFTTGESRYGEEQR